MNVHLAILRLAAFLVPRELRAEWSAEWKAELWYVCRERKRAAAFCLGAFPFCLGAFKDALWLRRNTPPGPPVLRLDSPVLCLLVLAGVAAISVPASLHFGGHESASEFLSHGERNLVFISHYRRPVAQNATVRLAEYQSWKSGEHRLFTGLAFYQPLAGRVRISGRRTAKLAIARASDNLFQLLNVPVPGPNAPVRLILSQPAWQEFFDRDPRVVGRVVDIAGQRALVAGVVPDSSWGLPGHVDAWLLEDRESLAALPPDSRGFVLARASKSSLRYMTVLNSSGGHDYFDCEPVSARIPRPVTGFLILVMMSGLLLPAVTSVSLGEYPADGIRRWMFLAAKFALVLLAVYFWARYLAYTGGPVHGLLVGCILAFRWVLVDQRRRCPVCLRLLTNPVRIGRPSQTFLEWYGTELMCARGHGLLHVPAIPNSCYATPQWLHLDRSWSGLFS